MAAHITEETGRSLSELFEILSHRHRRRILIAVAQRNPRDENDIISESVADADRADDDDLKHLKIQLYHTHLPKLADAGFIGWDRDSGAITRGPRFDEIAPLLRWVHDHQEELPNDSS